MTELEEEFAIFELPSAARVGRDWEVKEERGALIVTVSAHRVKVRLPLNLTEVHAYLAAPDQDAWIDDYLEEYGGAYEFERELLTHYEVRDVTYDGPDDADRLPPAVHPDQMTIEVDA